MMRNDIETPPVLEMKGNGLAFEHGGRRIEVDEATSDALDSRQFGIWIILSPGVDPAHHNAAEAPS